MVRASLTSVARCGGLGGWTSRVPVPAAEQAARLPAGPGVYRFRDAAGRVLYLGRAVSLRRRVASYWGDLGDRGHLAAMVARIARVEAVLCDSAHEAAWLERNLLQRRKPPWNRSPDGGQEAEVWIRLSGSGLSGRLPSLAGRSSALTWAARRSATPCPGCAGCCRSAPPRTGPDRPARRGSERELARARGACLAPAAPGRPGDLVRRPRRCSTGIRPRWPRCARSWSARRDAAAAAAGLRVRGPGAGRAGGRWTGSPPSRRSPGPSRPIFDVHGWADGVLVRFEVRGGRLSGWSQRACAAAAAPPSPGPAPRAVWNGRTSPAVPPN